MSLPLHPDEMRFNCARAETRLTRNRESLYHLEPTTGTFVVWRVLGFGGRPNPLLFARAASFATRTAQALLGTVIPEARSANEYLKRTAHGMLQTFVDDPALSVRGSWNQAAVSFDIVIAWWLALGIPLSWKKGAVYSGDAVHRWIGIDYSVIEGGARMRLPPEFITDLLLLLEPLCSPKGQVLTTSSPSALTPFLKQKGPRARAFVIRFRCKRSI